MTLKATIEIRKNGRSDVCRSDAVEVLEHDVGPLLIRGLGRLACLLSWKQVPWPKLMAENQEVSRSRKNQPKPNETFPAGPRSALTLLARTSAKLKLW